MYRLLSAAVLTAAIALGAASAASAQSAVAVERSGATFHKKVCGPANPGTARCHAHVVTDAQGNEIVRTASPMALPSGYGPNDLRSAYNITGTGTQAYTIAIVDAYGYKNAEADLATYRSTYGLPACTTANGCFTKYNQRGQQGSYPREDTGWAQETALDLDMASAMCPNCKIILVEADTASFGNLAAAVNMAAQLGADAISNSYGGSEGASASYESAYNHPGVAVTVSTGDNGYGVSFPSTSPHVIAVGGTHLVRSATARGWTETAWSGAGSGCSTVYAKPTWQTDTLCAKRTVADVSAVADPNTGVAVYGPTSRSFSGWMVFGGTSASAPLIAGIYGVNGGTANYGANPYGNTAGLFDVTSGSNGSCGGTYLCTAVPGFDGPTGLGTPNGSSAF
jgi:subtilase family serine protease